jgi:RNA polymerase sigma factor (TIGR02999 family)
MSSTAQPVTELLRQWRGGQAEAADALMPIVYDQLWALAARYMRGERGDHTLQTTALVHEAYVRLIDVEIPWQDRAHFFAMAARTMRRILVDHARSQKSEKRGGQVAKISLDEAPVIGAAPPDGMLDLHEALDKLAASDHLKAELIEMIYFGGMTLEESSAVLNMSVSTAHRHLRMAKAWLHQELSQAQ